MKFQRSTFHFSKRGSSFPFTRRRSPPQQLSPPPIIKSPSSEVKRTLPFMNRMLSIWAVWRHPSPLNSLFSHRILRHTRLFPTSHVAVNYAYRRYPGGKTSTFWSCGLTGETKSSPYTWNIQRHPPLCFTLMEMLLIWGKCLNYLWS